MEGFDDELKEVQRHLGRIIRNLFPYRSLHMPEEAWNPPMDVYETEEGLAIVVEVAGAAPRSLKISIEGGLLAISGRREPFVDPSHRKCHQMEIDFGSFKKQIRIPFAVDREKVTSQYRNGLLRIILPRCKEDRRRSIEISLE
ncbi:MAG: Hsp20/alpha crystallin family protein [Deltaproteobacteria bacterium]|nr:Hsp20/alpha crystallin family protein [Deltaproteobacteria bacterium]MBW2122563.1 Hsp20/alpha crystallin family protein [Deltaproteobacteria bacterium]